MKSEPTDIKGDRGVFMGNITEKQYRSQATHRESQDKSDSLGPIEKAVNEQLKSAVAEEGLDKGRRGTKATPQQIIGCKRSQEKILNAMCDSVPGTARPKPPNMQGMNTGEKGKTRSTRRRRRGPRCLSYSTDSSQE